MKYIYADRYGYWDFIDSSSEREALRISSGLSKEACLDYATTSIVGLAKDFTRKQMEMNDCEVATSVAGMDCQCGWHS